LLAGVSLFFVLIAYQLDLHCPYCRAIHWGMVGVVLCLAPLPTGVRWWHAVAWLVAGLLAANAAFHHRAIADVAAPTVPTTAPVDVDVSLAANRGRTYGDMTAPKTLEVVIDLTCRHCAEQYRPLMAALQPAITAKRVKVVVRHLVRPSQGASTPAAELALATAVIGEHATAMEVLLGSNPDAGFAGLKARVAEVVDPAKLDAVLGKNLETIRTVLADDQSRVLLLGIGPQTPSAVLIEDGKVTKRWAGNLPAAAIAAALDGAL
jgi:protein-disulfide isomerase